MLRLERIRKSELHVSLRGKEKFFNSTLVQALSIATGLHLFGLLLFHVTPYFIDSETVIFSPIMVNTDISAPMSALADTTPDRKHSRHLRPPKYATLELPRIAETVPERFESNMWVPTQSYQRNREWTIDPFVEEERVAAWEMDLSGPLAELELKEKPSDQEGQLVAQSERKRLLYDVKVENRTGRIFWYQLLDPVGEKRDHSDWITALQFVPKEGAQITSGRVEILYGGVND